MTDREDAATRGPAGMDLPEAEELAVAERKVGLPGEPDRNSTLIARDAGGVEVGRWFAGTGKWGATGGYWWDQWADVVWICLLRSWALSAAPAVVPKADENWRVVPGYDGHVEVSNVGNVRTLDRYVDTGGGRTRLVLGGPLTPYRRTKRTPHRSVKIFNKPVPVEHLVAAAWIGPRMPGQIVRHWDDDPTNNTVANILYGTYRDNALDRLRNEGGKARDRRRPRCDRQHLLESPNLKGRYEADCRACANARKYCRRNSLESDMQAISDRYYLELAMGVPEMRRDVRRILCVTLDEEEAA